MYIRYVFYDLFDGEIPHGFPDFSVCLTFLYIQGLPISHTVPQQTVPGFLTCAYLNRHRRMSVSTNARMASTKSSSVRVEFKYGFSIRPVATSKKPMRLVVPWRIYSNSIRAVFPGITGLSGICAPMPECLSSPLQRWYGRHFHGQSLPRDKQRRFHSLSL